MAALRPRGPGSAPHRGKNLAAKQLDAGEDLVLAHPRPTHPHREVVNAAAMLGDQHIDDARGRTHHEPLRRQRAELLLGGGVRIESESLQAPRHIGFVFLHEKRGRAADRGIVIGRAAHLEQSAEMLRWRQLCREPRGLELCVPKTLSELIT